MVASRHDVGPLHLGFRSRGGVRDAAAGAIQAQSAEPLPPSCTGIVAEEFRRALWLLRQRPRVAQQRFGLGPLSPTWTRELGPHADRRGRGPAAPAHAGVGRCVARAPRGACAIGGLGLDAAVVHPSGAGKVGSERLHPCDGACRDPSVVTDHGAAGQSCEHQGGGDGDRGALDLTDPCGPVFGGPEPPRAAQQGDDHVVAHCIPPSSPGDPGAQAVANRADVRHVSHRGSLLVWLVVVGGGLLAALPRGLGGCGACRLHELLRPPL
mmetsp:Transcript_17858/g.50838  ORF Transcript_17858/g.50838 Transcript_17858/m.50838 type:complete len:267 (+) Transcript_17858:858-1658(+)